MAKQVVSKYTPAMVALIRDASPVDFAVAGNLATMFNEMSGTEGFSAKSVVAKIMRMPEVTYLRKQPVSKTGEPIARKDAVVEAIEAIVGITLDGLEKSPKLTLQRLRATLEAQREAKAA